MKNVLITGVSAGIGRSLTKRLIDNRYNVWGIARRVKLLRSLKSEVSRTEAFHYSQLDLAKENAWSKLSSQLKRNKFYPNIVFFNAAILKQDLSDAIDIDSTRQIFEINFFSILEGVNLLVPFVRPNSQFILMSSLSSFKGNSIEGIGYSSSKAAISIAFETLYQKYKNRFIFKTIYFGPIASGMGPFNKRFPVMDEDQAVKHIINAINSSETLYYCPWFLFLIIKIIKMLPSKLYFDFLDLIQSSHKKYKRVS